MDEFTAIAGLAIQLKQWGNRPIYLQRNLYKKEFKVEKNTVTGFKKLDFQLGIHNDSRFFQECRFYILGSGEQASPHRAKYTIPLLLQRTCEVTLRATVCQMSIKSSLKKSTTFQRSTSVKCQFEISDQGCIRIPNAKLSFVLDDSELFAHNIQVEMDIHDEPLLHWLTDNDLYDSKKVSSLDGDTTSLTLYSKWISANHLCGDRPLVLYSHTDPQIYVIVFGTFKNSGYIKKQVEDKSYSPVQNQHNHIMLYFKGKGRSLPVSLKLDRPICPFCLGLPFNLLQDMIHHIENHHLTIKCTVKDEGLVLSAKPAEKKKKKKNGDTLTEINFDLIDGVYSTVEPIDYSLDDLSEEEGSTTKHHGNEYTSNETDGSNISDGYFSADSQIAESQDEFNSLPVQRSNPFQGMTFFDLSQDYEDTDEIEASRSRTKRLSTSSRRRSRFRANGYANGNSSEFVSEKIQSNQKRAKQNQVSTDDIKGSSDSTTLRGLQKSSRVAYAKTNMKENDFFSDKRDQDRLKSNIEITSELNNSTMRAPSRPRLRSRVRHPSDDESSTSKEYSRIVSKSQRDIVPSSASNHRTGKEASIRQKTKITNSISSSRSSPKSNINSLPLKRGPGRPSSRRGPGRPPSKRGPGRPPSRKGPGRPPSRKGPGLPSSKKGSGRPSRITK